MEIEAAGEHSLHADQPDGAAPFFGPALAADQDPQGMAIAEGQITGIDHDPGRRSSCVGRWHALVLAPWRVVMVGACWADRDHGLVDRR
ncbi:hypothetical protein [Nonomuraea jiangxiensis]|uniref:hypothetical protein n=1 Tax=Nonomuraea jiangxiensis TaxID=633440 RepID=UPI000B831671|nr:hypothetical protein [Nonomuraea jiangxiensis]